MGLLARLGVSFRRGFGRITPEPFVLAVGLSLLVLVAALVFGDWPGLGERSGEPLARLEAALDGWGGSGLWKLLAFSMQMVVILVLGTALAEAPPVRRGITGLASLARGPRMLVGITAFVSVVLSLLSWSLSLIGGALLAREAGRVARARGWTLHYPLLCAAAYTGLMCWHGGFSGTAPLKATTAKDMSEVLGPALAEQVGVIPLSESLLSPLNLVISGGLLVLATGLFMAMTPAEGEDPSPMAAPAAVIDASRESEKSESARAEGAALLDRLERSRAVVWMLALPMLAALGFRFARGGLASLDLNTVNLCLWVAALILHGRPDSFLAACERGIRSCTGIVLQFPLYAGIMAVMASSGLSAMITTTVASAGPDLIAPLTFLSAGLLNLLVPSGGGQWAVQGPIIMQAAVDTGVAPGRVLMAMAYGDQWTNMLQPFWALPLLAVTGVRARDIVGYAALWMLVGGAWILAALALLP
ncbi:short-chain fatty acid transporter [Pseudenhygromyxa sp. WMMC2535]|uniref:TIGR00366 family protein n=1 Tax=Pseudenhygromyxa sp. WMMC2535 TaxID=2712867 RepID=UPI001557AEAC|nr:TIGR00366 family protein [Pseudenhygromyxa sp. WMMC2535]NVB39868.1 short-chain fatty acid transporter [Pseudenhygromyxa sp. WMMC2535]